MPPLPRVRVAAALWPAAIVGLALLLAWLLRHRLVEPAGLTAACDAAPWQDLGCSMRTLTVMAFVQQRIGVLALALALLATWTRWRRAAWLALAFGGAALVLYSTGLAAAALLLGAMVCVRPGVGKEAR